MYVVLLYLYKVSIGLDLGGGFQDVLYTFDIDRIKAKSSPGTF